MSSGDRVNRVPYRRSPRKTIKDAQQELAENCGYGDKIIWDLLSANDDKIMEEKIKQLIPCQEKNKNAIKNLRQDIFNNVWAQRKYTNRNSVTSIFYVMVSKNMDFNTVLYSTEFSCHPVFRCKKCDYNSDSSNCCMIYVDETGRVYQNWRSFIENNVLPAGIMVTPRKGVYNFKENKVILDTYCTPNGSTAATVMNYAKRGTAVIGMGVSSIPLAALVIPVAAPVMTVVGFINLGIGTFSCVLSALDLADRNKHEQSIDITNSQARSNYFGVLGGVFGITAAGATSVLASRAQAGKTIKGIKLLVNGINISSLVVSGGGVTNSVIDLVLKYQDGDKISDLDVLQLSASLLLFTNSVYNFKLASQIANNARINSVGSYRETLSEYLRKGFDKLSEEIIGIRGNTQGKMDIIRGINNIPELQNENKGGDIIQGSFNVELFLEGAELTFKYGLPFMKKISDGQKFKDIVLLMVNKFSESIVDFLIKTAQEFIENFLHEIEKAIQTSISTESVLYRIFKQVLNNYRNTSHTYISQKGKEIIKALKSYFLSFNNKAGRRVKCLDCKGSYYICNL